MNSSINFRARLRKHSIRWYTTVYSQKADVSRFSWRTKANILLSSVQPGSTAKSFKKLIQHCFSILHVLSISIICRLLSIVHLFYKSV